MQVTKLIRALQNSADIGSLGLWHTSTCSICGALWSYLAGMCSFESKLFYIVMEFCLYSNSSPFPTFCYHSSIHWPWDLLGREWGKKVYLLTWFCAKQSRNYILQDVGSFLQCPFQLAPNVIQIIASHSVIIQPAA